METYTTKQQTIEIDFSEGCWEFDCGSTYYTPARWIASLADDESIEFCAYYTENHDGGWEVIAALDSCISGSWEQVAFSSACSEDADSVSDALASASMLLLGDYVERGCRSYQLEAAARLCCAFREYIAEN